MSSIRLLIVDDHPVVREGLCALLQTQHDFRVIGTAASGSEACHMLQTEAVDLVLVDLKMPQGDGFAVLSYLAKRAPTAAALVLTTYEDIAGCARARALGARGYQLKDVAKERLFESIRRVATGQEDFDPRLDLACAPPLLPSKREMEVLQALQRGESNRRIAQQLFISEATVKTHLQHLFEKLETNTRTGVVVEALRRGWLTLEQASSSTDPTDT